MFKLSAVNLEICFKPATIQQYEQESQNFQQLAMDL